MTIYGPSVREALDKLFIFEKDFSVGETGRNVTTVSTDSFLLMIDNDQSLYGLTSELYDRDRIVVIQRVRRLLALFAATPWMHREWYDFIKGYEPKGRASTLMLFHINPEIVADHIIRRVREGAS